jgi:hypothetical protein
MLSKWVKCPAGVVAQIMGDKPSAIAIAIAEKHYMRRPLDLLRMWHARIEAWRRNKRSLPSYRRRRVDGPSNKIAQRNVTLRYTVKT